MPNTLTEVASPVVEAAGKAVPTKDRPALFSQTLILLAMGHLFIDLYSSTVPTLQPLLASRFSLSLAEAGILGGMFMLASAVMQLPFGVISDRIRSRMFTVLSPLIAAVFLSAFPAATGFGSLLLLIALGGLGVAAFHPQSTTQAARQSGERSGLGVAFFIAAGMLGYALGPTYFSLITEKLGFEYLYIAVVPGIIGTLILYFRLPQPAERPKKQVASLSDIDELASRRPVMVHYLLVVVRSIVQLGIGQFLTLYLTGERGFSLVEASFVLTLFFIAATVGALLGGGFADRFGGKRVILISMIGSVPLLWAFLATSGWVSLLCLFAGGLVILLTIPVNVVMVQRLVPSKAGTVTALMMGFAWGMVGILCIPLIGWLGDHYGLEGVLWGVVSTPLAGFLLALLLPADSSESARQHV